MGKKFITFDDEDLSLLIANYVDNGRLYLGLEDREGGNYCDITANLPDAPCKSKAIVYLSGDLSKDLKNALQEKGLISYPVNQMPYNMGLYDKVIVDLKMVKDYNPKAYEEFEKYYNSRHGIDIEKENNINEREM